MLFKLSLKNIRKSYKDYTIYFLTLILGVSIFYVFNSIESQQAMFALSESTREIIKLMITMLSGISVGVSVILGFLIIYANGFLIRRRKKEFGIYMTLGMSKQNISMILIGETFIIGLLSLAVGITIGVFASQFMSILIGKMFEADMSQYYFVFSKEALIKTVLYFGIMFMLVILLNAFAIGRYKLVDLMNASRKNQVVKLKKPFLSVGVFVLSVAVLIYCYYSITAGYEELSNEKALLIIILGSVATYGFFWSLSGFFLTVLQKRKKFYLKNLNAFVLRQVHSKINTMVFTMTIICLMLFVSIGAITTGMSLKETCNQEIKFGAPADISIEKEVKKGNHTTIIEELEGQGIGKERFSEVVEISKYQSEEITMDELLLPEDVEELSEQYPYMLWESKADLYSVSEYNKIASLYGNETFSLEEDEYIAVCQFEMFQNYQDRALQNGKELHLGDSAYKPKYDACKAGMLQLGTQRLVFCVVILPDSAFQNTAYVNKAADLFAANYENSKKEELEHLDVEIRDLCEKKDWIGNTKIQIKESSVGVSAIVTFVGLYIGVIFMITSAAMLALKELSEASDNKERYTLLRKLGVEGEMIHKALFMQIGIFFILPLILAVVHAVFGITFMNKMLVILLDQNLLKPIVISCMIYGIIYIIYFLSTYFGSVRILEE